MKIAVYLFQMFPNFKGLFNRIEITLKVLEDHKQNTLFPRIKTEVTTKNVTKLVYRFIVFKQTVLWRIIDVSKAILICWENKNVASAFILLKSLYETVSVIYYANLKLDRLISEKDIRVLHKFIVKLTHGTRVKSEIDNIVKEQLKRIQDGEGDFTDEDEIREVFSATNILTVIDSISKINPNHREDYDHLSEYSHPNYKALLGLYANYKDDLTIELDNENAINEINIKNFFSRFSMSLDLFLDGYDGIVKKVDEINTIALEDLKNKGKSTETYDKEF